MCFFSFYTYPWKQILVQKNCLRGKNELSIWYGLWYSITYIGIVSMIDNNS